MTMKYLIILIASIFILSSCEKVIDLDLNDSNSQLVVDGFITDSLGVNHIRLSKTGSFYENNDFEIVQDAQVKIISSDGSTYNLSHVEDGYYSNPLLKAISGLTYQLEITYDEKIIRSTSYTPSPVYIDSLTYEKMDFGPPSDKAIYLLTCWFHDPAGEDNYYRIRLNTSSGTEDNFLVTDDKFFDGIQASTGIAIVEVGDTVNLDIFCIDKANYDYFNTISDASGTDNPGNPVSNIEGDNAIGYFGAYTYDNQSIIINPKK
jgi:hypothetical protein